MVKNLFDLVLNKYGRIDILVIAAGINASERIKEIMDESWERMISVNLIGVLFCI